MTKFPSASPASFVGKVAMTVVIYGAIILFISTNFMGGSDPSVTPEANGQSAALSDPAIPNDLVDKSPQTIEAKAASWAATSKSCMITLHGAAPHAMSVSGSAIPQIDDCTLASFHGIAANTGEGADEEPLHLLAIDEPQERNGVTNRIPIPAFRPSEANDPIGTIVTQADDKCDHRNLALKRGAYTLLPGVYCGGIIALNASQIELEPGIYFIKDGPFYLGGTSSLSGMNVALVFKGRNAVFGSGVSTSVKLASDANGPMSDILFFQDQNASPNSEFVIRSFDQQILVGTLYLPRGNLVLEMIDPEAQLPKSTSVVANQIEVRSINPVVTKIQYPARFPAKDSQVRRVAYAGN